MIECRRRADEEKKIHVNYVFNNKSSYKPANRIYVMNNDYTQPTKITITITNKKRT